MDNALGFDVKFVGRAVALGFIAMMLLTLIVAH